VRDTLKKKLIILGAGGFAEEALDLATSTGLYDVVSFVEGIERGRCGERISGIPIIWIDELTNVDRSHVLLCAVGSPKRRKFIEAAGKFGMEFTNIVHPASQVSGTVLMGKGVLVSVGVILAAGCEIGAHVIINRAAVVGHHVVVGDYATISPGANIGGGARIGRSSYIGMGAIILDHITVGQNSIVGAGAVVTKDVPDNVQVLGIPARVTKQLTEDM